MGLLGQILIGARPEASVPGAWVRYRTEPSRRKLTDAVWAMYVKTYSDLGALNVSDPSMLMEYDEWQIHFTPEGVMDAFSLSKSTPFGWKTGASGSDGSRLGKKAAILRKIELTARGGVPTDPDKAYWAEVSHKMLEIARDAGTPVVCNKFASILLPGKKLELSTDGVSYTRTITGVGPVTKQIYGKPVGVPLARDASACANLSGPLGGLHDMPRMPAGTVPAWMDADAELFDLSV